MAIPTKQALLQALSGAEGRYISGEQLAQTLGVSRAAIHKAAAALATQGYTLEAAPRRGYRLLGGDPFCADAVGEYPAPVYVHERLDSSNQTAKRLALAGAPHGTLVLAGQQSAGRGRMGRRFESPAGKGIYLSLVLRVPVPASEALGVTVGAAVAVARAVQKLCGIELGIKWVNDLYYQGKKVCGMLLEMNADEQSVHDVVAGIGINVHQTAFEGEIAKTASSLDLLTGRRVCRADVVRAFLEEYEAVDELAQQGGEALMAVYRRHSATLGQRVQVISATGSFTGTAKAVTDSGSLIVLDDDGREREVLAADVSVRGLMGYA